MKSPLLPAFAVAGMVFAGHAFAQTPPPPAPGTNAPAQPRIAFNAETVDTGRTIKGTPIKYVFEVYNKGDAPLIITSAHGSCSCTTTSWPTNLAPGDTGTIPVTISTIGGSSGPVDKTVTVMSNDPNRPMVTLRLHIETWLPIAVNPGQFVLNFQPNDAPPPSQTVHIVNEEPAPLTLSAPVSSNPLFAPTLVTNVPGREFDLTVTGTSHPAGQQTIPGTITLKTSSTNMPSLQISATAVVTPEITVSPAQIALPRGPLNQPKTQWIILTDNTGKGLNVFDPAVNSTNVDVTTRILVTNKQYALVLIFPPGYNLTPGSNVEASIKTDNPRMPIIHVPIYVAPGLAQPMPRVQQMPPARLTNLPGTRMVAPPAGAIVVP